MIVPVEQPPELDKYQVLEEIGHGGMATVYRAKDRRLGRDVAVKVIHKHLRESAEVAARFVSEARAVAKLKHQNIVEVYDVSDEDDPERYLVVELVEGTTLRKLLTEQGHLPAEIAAAIGIEIAQALEHAHAHGVIHRDVKPENVLVSMRAPVSTRESQERPSDAMVTRIKIADFGIAKLLDAQGVTSTGQVLGSPAHMAPEQIEGGEVSQRADVFGLGVLMYECMVGRLPFDGKNPAQVLRKVLDGTFTPPERARPTVGAGLSRIVEKALAREAADRWETAEEIAELLKAELAAVGMTEPRNELAEFLADPEAYKKSYDERIVEKLVALGKKARSERDVTAAAGYFNRALAFRPEDTELLREVAGLARAERMRRTALRAGVVVLGSAVLGIAAYGVTRAARTPRLTVTKDRPAEPVLSVTAEPRVVNSVPPDKSAAPAPSASVAKVLPHKVNGKVGVVPIASSAGKGKTRLVQIVVSGATGGGVLVDGAQYNWFGAAKPMTTGTHTFEFLPPDDKCCKKPPKQVIDIPEGETPFIVRGSVPFLDASLSLLASAVRAECPRLFAGALAAGQTRQIPISGPKRLKGQCTITLKEGEPDKVVEVSLGPGETRSIP